MKRGVGGVLSGWVRAAVGMVVHSFTEVVTQKQELLHTSPHTYPAHTSPHTYPVDTSPHTCPAHTSPHTCPAHTFPHTPLIFSDHACSRDQKGRSEGVIRRDDQKG
eukprot:157984-Chlamydomonas_euryale.AAC.1